MKKTKEDIAAMRNQMENSYEIDNINACEAEIKHKLEKVQELMRENHWMKQALENSKKEIDEVNRHGEYEVQKSEVSNELREIKKQWRTTYYNKIDAQKELINRHSNAVDLSKKCRKMYDMIEQYKALSDKQRQELKLNQTDNVIEQERLELMKLEVEKANKRRLEEEKHFEESITHQAKKIQDKQYEVKLLELRLKERDKELRLWELKAKEYKRQIRHNSLKPMPKDTGHTLDALVSPRYEPFQGAKMRYQQARNFYVSPKPEKKEVSVRVEPEPEEHKVKKQKIVEYVEPEKNYLQENMRRLKEKKRGKKKIGGVLVDEDQFKAMLKQFNTSVPSKSRAKSRKELPELKETQRSQSDFVKKEVRRRANRTKIEKN